MYLFLFLHENFWNIVTCAGTHLKPRHCKGVFTLGFMTK